MTKLLYVAAALLSAFLLFSVEPMAARSLLPLLGGSSAVWITALAFFQLVLLLGYGYALIAARASKEHPGPLRAHLSLLLAAGVFVFLPGVSQWRPPATMPPQLQLFLLLTASVALPFFVLSTTAPLLQAWYARRERAAVPYTLFGLSNLSSLLALLAYPLLVEPRMALHTQIACWRAGFVLYVALMTAVCLRMREAVSATGAAVPHPVEGVPQKRRGARWLWFALPAVASMQLAAVTSHLTLDVAPMPLLWVLPLAAYLLSFVLAFELPRLYRQGLLVRALAVLLGSLGYFLAQPGFNLPIGLAILFFVLELLVASWFLHAELYQLRPTDALEAPHFYLLMAAGGAAGTLAVAVLSPLLTDSNFDLPASFLLTALVALLVTWRAGWLGRLFWISASALGVALLLDLRAIYTHDALLRARNFYGSLRVQQSDLPPQAETSRILFNGSIQHGMQWFSADFRRTPLTYYAPDSGIGLLMNACCADRQRSVGVIGLGAGTLAAYGRRGDTIRFYEINPLVTAVGTHLFTYTRDTPAAVTIVPGDARLSLAAEPPQRFDVLVVDAFSGDSIPVHLLTREALDLYRRQLAPGGVIAFHISNRYLDLAPVLARLVEASQHSAGAPLVARRVDTQPDSGRGELRATWVLVTDHAELFQEPAFSNAQPVVLRSDVRLWTDQYSSLLPLVRWSGRDK